MTKIEENITEIENSEESEYESENVITNPFSTTKDITINNRIVVLPSLVTKLTHDEIDLNPEFQRNEDLWDRKNEQTYRVYILLKLPLPVFLF